jgi:Winged helix DNA-binding domain
VNAGAERVLTLRELNRATLARQLLLERKRLSPAAVIDRLVGMQAQSPSAPYIGIWARTASFKRATLERELAKGSVVRATVMRQTLHLVTKRDYAVIRAAMSETNFPWESAAARRLAPSMRALAAAGQITTDEALAYLEREHALKGSAARRAWRAARVRAHLVHHHESALWEGRSDGRFVAFDEPEAHVPLEARAELLRRYLAAFGPATRRDIVAWSMMHVPEIGRALDVLEPELRRFRDERGRELLDLRRAPLPDPDTPAPVRFLPKWDNVLLAHIDRTRVLPEPYRKRVIKMNGDVAQTFLVDGVVAGTWAHRRWARHGRALRATLARGTTRGRRRARAVGGVSRGLAKANRPDPRLRQRQVIRVHVRRRATCGGCPARMRVAPCSSRHRDRHRRSRQTRGPHERDRARRKPSHTGDANPRVRHERDRRAVGADARMRRLAELAHAEVEQVVPLDREVALARTGRRDVVRRVRDEHRFHADDERRAGFAVPGRRENGEPDRDECETGRQAHAMIVLRLSSPRTA